MSGILEGVVSTLFDHPSLKNVKKPILVAVVVAGRYIHTSNFKLVLRVMVVAKYAYCIWTFLVYSRDGRC